MGNGKLFLFSAIFATLIFMQSFANSDGSSGYTGGGGGGSVIISEPTNPIAHLPGNRERAEKT